MATLHLTRATPAQPAPSARSSDINLTRLYRAFVSPNRWRDAERCVFVEAATPTAAHRKIAGVMAALECSKPHEAAESIYNLASAEALIAEGLNEDHLVRLFETAWSGGKAICFVTEPLFLLARPAALIRRWAQIGATVQL